MVAALFFSSSTFPSALSSLRSPISTTLSPTLLRLHSPTPLSFCSKTHHPTNASFLCFSHWSEAEAPLSTSDFPPLYPENDDKWDSSKYEALLKGGEQVTSVLQDMVKLLEDMELDAESERAAVEIAAQGVIGKRVDEMESGFMMAIDYMIQIAEKDNDDKRKVLLEVIKQTVLDHLTKKCPPHVQVIGLLCRTPQKESRHELLCRVAAGGGVFKSENNFKVQLPGANLNDIANQADDLLETMESRPTVPDRKLLARLVLIREEARNMMGGGILDERNDRGLSTLPEAEGSITGRKPRPVRPGMFLETVSKVLGGIYSGNISGITAQHLEWVHKKTLEILQEMAF
ncbi:protein PEP-RELATED DEVELOPMENT ARRESTED 1, chloroplastic isoform X2 [Elaeis guineensis]|uniref:Protein PEP-RELATED DEVELOPMENT ARRESTED 1, chloroplastic isoform X2 n=1 Tax=Elaeis guineensis var. tenera TaxID=51953 RepID=A0A8N4ERC4_ELAGV|nr:protein PEP-RELATED DEVELOPMENT ARRESTED 1, chloroplastic isoform X2 [Elaeis guineensis]